MLLINYLLTAITLMMFFRKVGVDAGTRVGAGVQPLEVARGRHRSPAPLALLQLVPGAAIVTTVFLVIGMHRSDIAFGKETGWIVLAIFLPWLWCILLSQPAEEYHPERLAAAGYPPPHAGYGSVPRPVTPSPAP